MTYITNEYTFQLPRLAVDEFYYAAKINSLGYPIGSNARTNEHILMKPQYLPITLTRTKGSNRTTISFPESGCTRHNNKFLCDVRYRCPGYCRIDSCRVKASYLSSECSIMIFSDRIFLLVLDTEVNIKPAFP